MSDENTRYKILNNLFDFDKKNFNKFKKIEEIKNDVRDSEDFDYNMKFLIEEKYIEKNRAFTFLDTRNSTTYPTIGDDSLKITQNGRRHFGELKKELNNEPKIISKAKKLIIKINNCKEKSDFDNIRESVESIVGAFYNKEKSEELIGKIGYLYNFSKTDRESLITILDNVINEYEYAKESKNYDNSDINKSFRQSITINNIGPSNTAINSPYSNQNITQINSFLEVYKYIKGQTNITNKKEIIEKVKEIEEESKKENISKPKIKTAIDFIYEKAKDSGKEIVYQVAKAFFDSLKNS